MRVEGCGVRENKIRASERALGEECGGGREESVRKGEKG